jgi:very-short-patch-repair endonuclease
MAKLTKLETIFWDAWQIHGLTGNDLKPHVDVHLGEDLGERQFDFASEMTRVIVEIHGLGGFDPSTGRERCGGHQTARGMTDDCRRINAAVQQGWRVLVFVTPMVKGTQLLESIQAVNELMAIR